MQSPDFRSVVPILVGVLVLWAMYRRVRRSFGAQAVNPIRLRLRIGVLGLVSALLLIASARNLALLATLLAGAACGTALAYIGLRHTKFEVNARGRFYTPHTYMGLLVTALFVGRILLRLLPTVASARATLPSDPDPLRGIQSNPATLATFGILMGYYLFYYVGVLWKSAREGTGSILGARRPVCNIWGRR
jgi:hypothetical protein